MSRAGEPGGRRARAECPNRAAHVAAPALQSSTTRSQRPQPVRAAWGDKTMRILVAYGSKRGGTRELAQVIAETLSHTDHDIVFRDARAVEDIDPYDAVIVGGALYAFRWHRHARRFVQRHVEELRRVPVWMFSSGPLDDSATQGEIPPTPQVRRLMQEVHARGHATFGGRLAPETTGFIARKMVEGGHGGAGDGLHPRRW